ncbi:hypothetical protein K2173_010757 [Erythroxylum novogranatense]|uniref:Uncharacterized protein n=1 Tax=Erythroxylum novogranatense TaxID=1862640 RepID=A0AAV8SRM1_9ROSI|nr:hypothetical protein K2173_010757 [Erythroxylum novogranatense]
MCTSSPCCDKSGLKKGPWTADEDEKLIDYIKKHGHGKWRTLPKNAGLKRCGKSCRLRWINYLRPDIKRGKFSCEEEDMIIQLHSVLGNKWSVIAGRLPGRTDNEIKNYWNTHIKKRLFRMGIDPATHILRLDSVKLYSALSSSSHQLNPSRLLGIGSTLNPDLLNRATSLLSGQGNSHKHDQSPRSFQESQFLTTQFQSLEPNQVQYTHPSSQFLYQDQFMEPNLDQLSNILPTTFSWQNSLREWWPTNGGPSPASVQNCGNEVDSQSFINSSAIENLPNWSFNSNLSTRSWSTTPLNSSSATYVNGGTEDERESYSGSVLTFEIPNILKLGAGDLL